MLQMWMMFSEHFLNVSPSVTNRLNKKIKFLGGRHFSEVSAVIFTLIHTFFYRFPDKMIPEGS